MFEMLILMLDATIRTAPPLILAAEGSLWRACFANAPGGQHRPGRQVAGLPPSPVRRRPPSPVRLDWAGCRVGISILFALLHGFATITHRGDQVVSGMAINILAAGLTVTLGRYWFRSGAARPRRSPAMPASPHRPALCQGSMTCPSSASSTASS